MGFDKAAVNKRMLIAPDAMARVDQRTIDGGTPQATLVTRAARACFSVLRSRFSRRPVTILAGPGNNGEDGLLLGTLLAEAGWPLTIIDLVGADVSRPDLGSLAQCLRPTGTFAPGPDMLVIDAMFGAGLSRPLDGEAKALAERLENSGARVLAIDLPSGVDGRTGEVLGAAPVTDVTVTFHRLKPGHLLGEGALRCGDIYLKDIGLLHQDDDASALWNDPSLWRHLLVPGGRETHKYARGHAAVIGGPGLKGGAARLSAHGASVSGAGAVTFFSPRSSAEFAANSFDAVMVKSLADPEQLAADLEHKISSVIIGPGMGHGPGARAFLDIVLESRLPCVLDADALTLYADTPATLFGKLHEACVLTPHEGEFLRLFPGLKGDKLSRALAASERAGATVLLKGSTTVIAGSGLPIINTNGGPALATAGSGDVLAGVIGGLLAQGLGPCEAAAAGAWLHAEAGRDAGPGLHADALPRRIAEVVGGIAP